MYRLWGGRGPQQRCSIPTPEKPHNLPRAALRFLFDAPFWSILHPFGRDEMMRGTKADLYWYYLQDKNGSGWSSPTLSIVFCDEAQLSSPFSPIRAEAFLNAQQLCENTTADASFLKRSDLACLWLWQTMALTKASTECWWNHMKSTIDRVLLLTIVYLPPFFEGIGQAESWWITIVRLWRHYSQSRDEEFLGFWCPSNLSQLATSLAHAGGVVIGSWLWTQAFGFEGYLLYTYFKCTPHSLSWTWTNFRGAA